MDQDQSISIHRLFQADFLNLSTEKEAANSKESQMLTGERLYCPVGTIIVESLIQALKRIRIGKVLLVACVCMIPVSRSAYAQSVTMAWDRNSESDLAGYNVYRSQQSGVFNSAPLNGATLITTTSFTDSTVQSNQTYYYVVTAVNARRTESLSSNQLQVKGLAPGSNPSTADSSLTLIVSRSGGTLQGPSTPIVMRSDDPRTQKLDLLIDGQLQATSIGNSLSYRWDTRLSPGSHNIQGIVYGAEGVIGSKIVTVFVY